MQLLPIRKLGAGGLERCGGCYGQRMKNENQTPITGPLLKDIVELDRANQAALPKIEQKPQQSADFLHDSGNGYNTNLDFIQE